MRILQRLRTELAARWAIAAALLIVLIHFALLACSIYDYRVTIDSAFHVSMARAYAYHWPVAWDRINFGPAGRPNLQGPLLYIVMAVLGRLLGGRGDDFVVANAILGVAQWLAAVGTVGFFAHRLRGDCALLMATALFCGAGFAATSFAVGIPSGWLFILTPWAIYCFIAERLTICTLLTAAAIYVHLGGCVTTPLGLICVALLTERWRSLLWVAIAVALLSAPYLLHVARYADWLSGVSSHSALLIDPMLDMLALIGTVVLFKKPRRNVFMVAWLCAPVAWLFQDPGRFILQSALAGSVAASLLMVEMLNQVVSLRRRNEFVIAFAAVATLMPLGPPALASEAAWDAGLQYPRAVDWKRARMLEADLEDAKLIRRLVDEYVPLSCPALAVFGPVTCEKGGWVEVQPHVDPADQLAVEDKVYILPLPRDDPALRAFEQRRWIEIHGAAAQTVAVTFARDAPTVSSATVLIGRIIADSARSLQVNAVDNALTVSNWRELVSPAAMVRFRGDLQSQRRDAGRIELAALAYAWMLEPTAPRQARAMRRAARAFGVIAGFLGDDFALDFLDGTRFAAFKQSLHDLVLAAEALERNPSLSGEPISAFDEVIKSTLVMRGETFAERAPHDLLPWWPNS